MNVSFPLISIIMPAYNSGRFIGDSIESVISQNYTNWELLIVDDCSTDDTVEIVRKFAELDDRIRLFQNERQSGAAVSRNLALRMAQGRYIAFLDSDDLWNTNKLDRQLSFMQENGYAFSYTRYREIDVESNSLGVELSGPKHIPRRLMLCCNWIGCLTVIYDAQIVGLLQIADIRKRNDYAIWLKVIRKADCYLFDECLASYRRRTGSISSAGAINLMKYHYQLFRFSEGYGTIRSWLLALRNLPFIMIKKMFFSHKY